MMGILPAKSMLLQFKKCLPRDPVLSGLTAEKLVSETKLKVVVVSVACFFLVYCNVLVTPSLCGCFLILSKLYR